MSKRNFILLIIVLIIAVVGFFMYFNYKKPTSTDNGDNSSFFSRFNPFRTNPPTNPPPVVTPPVDVSEYQPPVNNTGDEVSKLKKVSSMGIAGYGIFMKERLRDVAVSTPVISPVEVPAPSTNKKGKKVVPTPPLTEFMPALRYVERATGNIYQTFVDKIEERKFTTTIIPKVYEAYFGINAGSVIMRYLKLDERTITTFLGSLPKEYIGADTTTDNEVKGSFLPDNVTDVSISPDGQKMFYLFNVGDNVVGTVNNFSDNKKLQVFDSPFTEWLSQWPNNKLITLTTKASSGVPGYIYTLNLESKNFNKTFGGIKGLTTLTSPNGKLVLYSGSNLLLNIYHTDTRVSQPLGIRSLSEKCVWNNGSSVVYCAVPKSLEIGQYPDAWYQGEVSFSDQIWKTNVVSGTTSIIADPSTLPIVEQIDGIKLTMDTSENYLFFVNKKDSFLWELKLPTPASQIQSTPVVNSSPTTTNNTIPPANTPALSTPTPSPTPTIKTIDIKDFSFSQTSLTINKGDTVVWTNKDSAPHTVTGDNGGPSSGTLNQNQTYSFTFNSIGTFSYHCNFHPSMKGSVSVK